MINDGSAFIYSLVTLVSADPFRSLFYIFIFIRKINSKTNKMLSYRRETALQGALYFSPKVEH